MSLKRLAPRSLHLVDIQEVRRLYDKHTGGCAARNTVTRWLVRRQVPSHGPNPKQRLFDLATIKAALETDFPPAPKFLKVEDAFYLAGLPYPKSRHKEENEPACV